MLSGAKTGRERESEREREREREDTTSQSGVSSCLRRQWSLPVQTRPPAFYDLTVYCCLEELKFVLVKLSKDFVKFTHVNNFWKLLKLFDILIRGES